jgi:carboxyl-terminal processing protease
MKQREQQPEPEAVMPKVKKTPNWWTVVVVAAVVAVVAFVGGTRSGDIMALLHGSQNSNLPSQLDVSSLQDVYQKLREQFDGKLDTQKLIDGAKKGLVEAGGDPYTVYFTDEEAKQFLSDLDGKFSGIGAELGKKDDRLVVVSTLDDSPAQKAGLQANDTIVKVNDQDTSGWSIDKAVSEIRGDKGTTVKLAVVRAQALKEFSIVRDEIINPSVKYEITSDNIGYLRISRFADTDTVTLAKKAANEFKQKGVKGVVLDLRGDGGGYLGAAQEIAGIWLDNKVVVQEKRGDTVIDTLKSGNSPILNGVPTVVLIDGGSASASEIVAGALHDHGAAKLVGVKSFGKGSVQQIEDIASGGQLKVTIAKWYTPNGKNINKEGIEPDVKVELSDQDIAASNDTQKAKAFDIVKNP